MTEWGVVGVLVVLVGLVAAVYKPLLNWNSNLTRNTEALNNLTKTIDKNETRNEKEHVAIWDEVEKHGETINDHETRLQLIEHK